MNLIVRRSIFTVMLSGYTDKSGEELVRMRSAIENAFIFDGGDNIELSTKNDSLMNKVEEKNEKCLDEAGARQSRKTDDKEKTDFLMKILKMQKRNQK